MAFAGGRTTIRTMVPLDRDFGPYAALLTELHTRTMTASDGIDQGGDRSRGVAGRRAELGLSLEDVAEKTGIDPSYLSYFEQDANACLSVGSTLLLAQALEITPAALLGKDAERPLRRGRAGPRLETLTPRQCEAHLGAGGVGRVVFTRDRGPVALPVNYEYTDRQVVISTDVDKAHFLEAQEVVGFEVDRVDDVLCEGWSVLVTGPARRVDHPDELLRLASLHLESWAGGGRHALVAISAEQMTGRVIIHPVTSA